MVYDNLNEYDKLLNTMTKSYMVLKHSDGKSEF